MILASATSSSLTPPPPAPTHRRLARVAANAEDRAHHIQAARAAWLKAERPDLLEALDKEFGPPAAS